MEHIENNQQTTDSLIIGSEVKSFLLETAKWGKFLAVLGYIGMGFLVVVAFALMLGSSFINQLVGQSLPILYFGILYLIMGLIYYFPVTYLYLFSDKMKRGLLSEDQESISAGFKNLKSLFKFMGIMTIVILSIYVLLIILAVPLSMYFAQAAQSFPVNSY